MHTTLWNADADCVLCRRQEYLDLGLPSPPDSAADSSRDVSVDSQFELCKSTAM